MHNKKNYIKFKYICLYLIISFCYCFYDTKYSFAQENQANCLFNISNYFGIDKYFELKCKNDFSSNCGIQNSTISDINVKYSKFLALPDSPEEIKSKYLFTPLYTLETNEETQYNFCGFSTTKKEIIECEYSRINDCISVKDCNDFESKENETSITEKIVDNLDCDDNSNICLNYNDGELKCTKNNDKNCDIGYMKLNCTNNSCTNIGNEKFIITQSSETVDNKTIYTYVVNQKKYCYPDNHICYSYKEYYLNRYFNIDKNYIDSSIEKNKTFYIYKKNIIQDDNYNNTNCKMDKFLCDFKIKNELKTGNNYNVVNINTDDFDNNRKFIDNATSGLGDAAFFKYRGTCDINSVECQDILKAKHFFKILLEDNKKVLFFVKNINFTFGTCYGYLPNCDEIEDKKPLYDNRSSNDNINARKNFYSYVKNKVYEENLWFVNSNNFPVANCLSMNSNNNNSSVGYCSDLKDDLSGLKYNSFSRNNSNKYSGKFDDGNCYFKSCIDLTPKELEYVSSSNKKLCSEYVWLNNSYNFKYFPKENPPYCSDIKSNSIIFENGFEKDNPKCYLKNCFSLENNERNVVIKKKYENILKKFGWAYNISGYGDGEEHDFNEYELPVYCKSGYFFTKDSSGYSDLDYINFNINSCNNFSENQLNSIKNSPVVFTIPLQNGYNTYSHNEICRTHARTLNRFDLQVKEVGGFLQTAFIGDDETNILKKSYKEFLKNNGWADFDIIDYNNENFDIKIDEVNKYAKISSSVIETNEKLRTQSNFNNYCSYVDNLFLYQDAEIDSLSRFETYTKDKKYLVNGFDNEEYHSLIANITAKASSYTECSKKCPTNSNTNDLSVCSACEDKSLSDEEIIKCMEKNNDKCKSSICQKKCAVNNKNEEKYFDIKDIINDTIIDCNTFNSIKNTDQTYYDCDLYTNSSILNKKINSNLSLLQPINDPKEEEKLLSDLNSACADEYDFELPEVTAQPNNLLSYIKPYYDTTKRGLVNFSSFDPTGGLNPNRSSRYRMGCSDFMDDDSLGFNEIELDSSYISSEKDNDEKKYINTIETNQLSSGTPGILKNFLVDYCLRAGSSEKCGRRYDSQYKDRCLKISIPADNSELKIYNDEKGKYDGSVRFIDKGRNVYFIKNVVVDSKRVFKKFDGPKENYIDEKNLAFVLLECTGVATAAGSAAFAATILIPVIGQILAPIITPIVFGATMLSCSFLRESEYKFNLEKGVSNKYNYKTEKGFIPILVVANNDNFMYNYYPRSTKIEDDLKNKLSYNKKGFLDGVTLEAQYIIEKCSISDFIQEKNDCQNTKNNCEYIIKDYSKGGECDYKNENNLLNCFTKEQRSCLESFGVTILDTSFFNEKIRKGLMKDYSFLKEWKDGETFKLLLDFSNKKTNYSIPSGFTYYTKNKTEPEKNKNCKITNWGDPEYDLRDCRGFEYENVFYTESQPFKKPLLSSPPLFYNLITYNNTPELFLPSIFLKYYYNYAGHKYDTSSKTNKILNFFNPKLKFDYDMGYNSNDPGQKNLFSAQNNVPSVQEVYLNSRYSYPYELRYKKSSSNNEFLYRFILEKAYVEDNKRNIAYPMICLHKISDIPLSEENKNFCLKEFSDTIINDSLSLNGDSENKKSSDESNKNINSYFPNSNCLKIIEENIYCFDREMPGPEHFAMKQDDNIDLLYPVINVFVKPVNLTKFEDFNKQQYAFVDSNLGDNNNSESANNSVNKVKLKTFNAVYKNIINKTQGIKLELERSFCSEEIYNYYKLNNIILGNKENIALINNSKVLISSIEKNVIPYCRQVNGGINKILLNQSDIKTYNETKDVNEVVYMTVGELRERPESYGGFNEICLSNNNLEDINSRNRAQKGTNFLRDVVVFKSDVLSPDNSKCLLNNSSLANKNCLYDDEVFIYCNKGDNGCVRRLNITKSKYEYVKSLNCLEILEKAKNNIIVELNVEEIKACYKGGYNQYGIIYKKDGSGKEDSCVCTYYEDYKNYNTNYFAVRRIKAREMGFCVDLFSPEICPSVKYYDGDGKYVDDNLVLNKTKEEIDNLIKNGEENIFEQHLWRTKERQIGIVPSVFFSDNLGHAEFGSSSYCGFDGSKNYTSENCLGGKAFIEGECRGFWNYYSNNKDNKPLAACKKYDFNGKNVYEYTIVSNPCERFICPDISNGIYTSEVSIIKNTNDVFTDNEILDFASKVEPTKINSTVNNEEIDDSSFDVRGANNGFAIWPKIVSSDYTVDISAISCLDGYGPANSNYKINEVKNSLNTNIFINYNYIPGDYTNTSSDNFIKVNNYSINYLEENVFKILHINKPERLCNQKGEWQEVRDMYNSNKYNEGLEKNKYYSNQNKEWLERYKSERIGKYCERIICKEITSDDIGNKNVFDTEIYHEKELNSGGSKNKPWFFSGGATWPNMSAPRNDSKNLTLQVVSGDYAGKNLNNVFANEKDVLRISSIYKYLKKVNGVCYIKYGYYNNDAKFTYSDFESQISSIRDSSNNDPNAFKDTGVEGYIRTQNYSLLTSDYDENTKKPMRTCNSYGLWSGIQNNCIRACELMDIYHTDVDSEIIKSNDSNKLFINNNDIIKTKISLSNLVDVQQNEREKKFTIYNLDTNQKLKDLKTGVFLGDYLTGGAQWSRSIVASNITNRDPEHNNLRYIEVKGVCDNTYERNDGKIRQYVKRNSSIVPTRKCYEDGTWGPVYDDTRCILFKTCSPFKFTVYNLYSLISIYSGKSSLEINKYLNSDIIALDKIIEQEKIICSLNNYNTIKRNWQSGSGSSIKLCKIANFNTENASFDKSIYSTLLKNDKLYKQTTYNMLCNMTGYDASGSYSSGWNFENTEKIDNYFVPLTCDINSSTAFDTEIINSYNKYGKGALSFNVRNKSYVKESFLEFIYDKEKNIKVDKNFMDIYTNGTINKEIPLNDVTGKDVKIGSKEYSSYQIKTICNSEKYYNVLKNNDDYRDKYYTRNIVLECTSNNTANPTYKYVNNTKTNISEGDTIRFDDCQPKECGGKISFQRNWSESMIDEVDNKNLYDKKTSESTVRCPEGSVFVVKGSYDYGKVSFYSGISENESKSYGLLSGLKTTCHIKKGSTINGLDSIKIGTTIYNNESYLYNKSGELQFNGLPKIFCQDLKKANCQELSEDYIMNEPEFTQKYCVSASCPVNSLSFDFANKTVTNDGYIDLTQNNAKKKYDFKDILVIESVKGDYSGIGDVIASRKICPDNADIYNADGSSGIGRYTLEAFKRNHSTDEVKKIEKCFAWLSKEDIDDEYETKNYSPEYLDYLKGEEGMSYINLYYWMKDIFVGPGGDLLGPDWPDGDFYFYSYVEKANEYIIEYGKKLADLKIKNITQDKVCEIVEKSIFIDETISKKVNVNSCFKKELTGKNFENRINYLVEEFGKKCNEKAIAYLKQYGTKINLSEISQEELDKYVKIEYAQASNINNNYVKTYLKYNVGKSIYEKTENGNKTYYLIITDKEISNLNYYYNKQQQLYNDDKEENLYSKIKSYVNDPDFNYSIDKNFLKKFKKFARAKDFFDREMYYYYYNSYLDKNNLDENVDFMLESDDRSYTYSFFDSSNDSLEISYIFNIKNLSDFTCRKTIIDYGNCADSEEDCSEEIKTEYTLCENEIIEKYSVAYSNFEDKFLSFLNYYNDIGKSSSSSGVKVTESECTQYYKDYLSKKNKYYEEQNKSEKFRSGFFVAMKCTPAGEWELLTENLICLKRCNGSNTFLDSKYYDVRTTVNNMRSGKTYSKDFAFKRYCRGPVDCGARSKTVVVRKIFKAICDDGNLEISKFPNIRINHDRQKECHYGFTFGGTDFSFHCRKEQRFYYSTQQGPFSRIPDDKNPKINTATIEMIYDKSGITKITHYAEKELK